MKYNTQLQDDPTIQHFILGDSPELNSENIKGLGSGGLHIRNQMVLNDKTVYLRSHMRIQSVRCRLSQIYILYFECIKTSEKKKNNKKKTDAYTMYGNKMLPVTYKACVSHFQILLQQKTRTMASVNNIPHNISFEMFCMTRVKWIMAPTNRNVIRKKFPEVLR